MSNEVIAFACPKCGKKLRVKAALAGKPAACPSCQTRFRVPMPKPATSNAATSNAATSGAATSPASSSPSADSTRHNPTLAANPELGLGSGLRNENDLFRDVEAAPNHPNFNPLGNHVVDDPGFFTGEEAQEPVRTETDEEGFARNPLIVQMEQEQERQRKQMEVISNLKTEEAPPNPLQSVPVVLGIIYGLGFFFSLIFAFSFSAAIAAWIAFGLLISISPVSLGLKVWGVLKVAKNETENQVLHILLFIFVPLYDLIFSILRWHYLKSYFGALCVLIGSSIAGGIILVVIGIIAANQTY